MTKVHGKDTAIERKVRSYLYKRGYRFRKHVAGLPGSPDIVLSKYRVTVFIHGCFWHGHSDLPPHLAAPTLRIRWLYKHTPLAFCGSMSCVA